MPRYLVEASWTVQEEASVLAVVEANSESEARIFLRDHIELRTSTSVTELEMSSNANSERVSQIHTEVLEHIAERKDGKFPWEVPPPRPASAQSYPSGNEGDPGQEAPTPETRVPRPSAVERREIAISLLGENFDKLTFETQLSRVLEAVKMEPTVITHEKLIPWVRNRASQIAVAMAEKHKAKAVADAKALKGETP